MNNIQLRIRVDALQSSHTPEEGTLVVSGTCSFKFYDNKKTQVRPLQFVAYGQSAVTLTEGGIDSVHLISGRLNVYKPTEQNPNHQAILTVEKTTCIQPGKKTNNVVSPSPQKAPVSPPSPVQSNHQQIADIDLAEVPF